jgi:hypothetical protein
MRKVLTLLGVLLIPAIMLLVGWSIRQNSHDVVDRAATKAAFIATFGADPPTNDAQREQYQPLVVDVLDSLNFDVVRAEETNQNRRLSNLPQESLDHYERLSLAHQKRYNRAIELALKYHITIGSHPKK